MTNRQEIWIPFEKAVSSGCSGSQSLVREHELFFIFNGGVSILISLSQSPPKQKLVISHNKSFVGLFIYKVSKSLCHASVR